MAKTITIDPLIRIEGHLKFSTKIENSIVTDVKCTAQLYRGIEKALIGYDARAAQQITQRICGTCNYAHGEASSLALEDAMGIKPNKNGQLLRNLIVGAYQLHDYIFHFYLLSVFDFINIDTISSYKGTNNNLLRLKEWVENERKSGKIFPMSPFLPNFKATYAQEDSLNFFLIDSYIEAFDIMQKLDKAVAIFGGKAPHPITIEAGGVTTIPNLIGLEKYKTLIEDAQTFIKKKYLPNIIALSKEFSEYFKIGQGYTNYLSFPYFPDEFGQNHMFAGGVVMEGKYEEYDLKKIMEDTRYSYYSDIPDTQIKPLSKNSLTPIDYTTFKEEQLKKNGKYSWCKAPRYAGNVMEVGPIARVITTYLSGKNKKFNTFVDEINHTLGISFKDYNSVMGRHLCRALISHVIIDRLAEDVEKVEPDVSAFVEHDIPKNAQGIGLTEGTRGALAHWIQTDEQGLIKNYELIVPTTWNISPRDASGMYGAVEKMLLGTHIKDVNNPIELARIIRSTDPCIACSVH